MEIPGLWSLDLLGFSGALEEEDEGVVLPQGKKVEPDHRKPVVCWAGA